MPVIATGNKDLIQPLFVTTSSSGSESDKLFAVYLFEKIGLPSLAGPVETVSVLVADVQSSRFPLIDQEHERWFLLDRARKVNGSEFDVDRVLFDDELFSSFPRWKSLVVRIQNG